eukprot:m51a1_g14188 putative N-terminal acetyltransferase (880) ;mRNA; f:79108-82597
MASKDPQQVLPQREQSLFKSILKHYEAKAYKKALTAADEILEHFPHNGETLAMKGLVQSGMPNANKKAALDLIKEGVRRNLFSCTTWHVLGLYHRADRNYAEAVKCYKSALKWDKDNTQIMRDLASMQVHIRDYEGFFETRRQLLLSKGQPSNFVALALASHLRSGAAAALAVLDKYFEASPNAPDGPNMEYSELVLYRLALYEELAGSEPEPQSTKTYARALAYLEEQQAHILDKMAVREKRALLQLRSGSLALAQQSYRALLDLNSENSEYYRGLQEAMGVTGAEAAPALSLYAELEAKYPRSNLCSAMRLRALPAGADFDAALDAYLQKALRKGVPSLFQLLRWVYDDPARTASLGALLSRHLESLAASGVFAEPPTTYLWTMNMQAQHLAHTGECARALEVIERAIAHTPTAVDLYATKGRILKRAGDLRGAADAVELARSLDQADRFLNTLSTRYHLRAGRAERGMYTISPFTKDSPDVLTGMSDIQCSWFEHELALCRLRRGEVGAALHTLAATAKHFADFREDQFDFHYYGPFRRGTLRDYMAMLRAASTLDRHPYYLRSAVTAARAWLRFAEDPDAAIATARNPPSQPLPPDVAAAAAEDERQKEKERQKKSKQAKEEGSESKKPDADPQGLELMERTRADPLGEAARALAPLLEAAGPAQPAPWAACPWAAKLEADLHFVACDVHTRRGKRLLALRELRRAVRALGDRAADDARVYERAAAIWGGEQAQSSAPAVAAALQAEREDLAKAVPAVLQAPAEYAAAHAGSVRHAVAAARALVAARRGDAGALAEAAVLVTGAQDPACAEGAGANTLALPHYVEALAELRGPLHAGEAACEAYRERCARLFPRANAFESAVSSADAGAAAAASR